MNDSLRISDWGSHYLTPRHPTPDDIAAINISVRHHSKELIQAYQDCLECLCGAFMLDHGIGKVMTRDMDNGETWNWLELMPPSDSAYNQIQYRIKTEYRDAVVQARQRYRVKTQIPSDRSVVWMKPNTGCGFREMPDQLVAEVESRKAIQK